MKQKFQMGDKAIVVNYGSLIFYTNKEGVTKSKDLHPEYIGEIVTIQGSYKDLYGGNTVDEFAIIPHKNLKTAWWHENQLELIN